jgi:hypothetical protein
MPTPSSTSSGTTTCKGTSFMTSWSLSGGMEIDQVPDKGDMMPFSIEEAVMIICDERPLPGRHRVPNPSLGTPAHYDWGCGNMEI